MAARYHVRVIRPAGIRGQTRRHRIAPRADHTVGEELLESPLEKGGLHAQSPQHGHAARRQPVAAHLLTREGCSVYDQHVHAFIGQERGSGASGRPRPHHQHVRPQFSHIPPRSATCATRDRVPFARQSLEHAALWDSGFVETDVDGLLLHVHFHLLDALHRAQRAFDGPLAVIAGHIRHLVRLGDHRLSSGYGSAERSAAGTLHTDT